MRGGRFKVVNSRFVRNRCDRTGPDLGGAAIRVLEPVQGPAGVRRQQHVRRRAGQGGVCSNGGALSSIGVSWVVLNSVFSHNSAIGRGANPARGGTPGGGSGGAIYTDGNQFTVTDRRLDHREQQGQRGRRRGLLRQQRPHRHDDASRTRRCAATRAPASRPRGFPGIFFLGARRPTTTGSTLQK